ncbi:MAG: protein kinase [Phycisphaeraceae bacterium]
MNSLDQQPGGQTVQERSSYIYGVIESVRHRRRLGEPMVDDQVISSHPDLMPELGLELARLARIEEARQAAIQSDAHPQTDQSGATAPPSQFQILTQSQLDAPLSGEIEDAAESLLQAQGAGEAGDDDAPAALPQYAIAGYELVNEIGRGGQAVVYEAVQQSTGQRVAVKVMRAGPFASARERAMVDREVNILASVRHASLVGIIDRGLSTDGSMYLVMPFIIGKPLDQYVRLTGLRDTNHGRRRLLELFIRVAQGVQAAHQVGVIHRDLKPSNILVDDFAQPRLLDFGLARIMHPGTEGGTPGGNVHTVTGVFVGSLPYASPEQAAGQHQALDPRTDVYALGVMLYQLLTREYPYSVTGPMRDVMNTITTVQPPPPSRLLLRGAAGRSDRVLDAIVLKALAKSPAKRYANAGELAADLEHLLAGKPTVAWKQRRHAGRHRVMTLAVAAMLVMVVGSVSGLLAVNAQRQEADQWSAVVVPMLDVAVIPQDAVTFNGHSYRMYDGRWTWEEARAKAGSMGGYLMVVNDESEAAFMGDLVRFGKNGKGLYYWWLGLESDGMNKHRAQDGGAVTFTRFSPTLEPDGAIYGVCTRGDFWNLRDKALAGGFVVEWNGLRQHRPLQTRFIPADALMFNGHRYHLYDTPMTQRDAIKACVAAGGRLVTVESAEENRFIADLIGRHATPPAQVWIGAYFFHDKLFWSGGSTVKFAAFAPDGKRHNNERVYWTPQGWSVTNGDADTHLAPYICEWVEP